jgi:hypothetical protein
MAGTEALKEDSPLAHRHKYAAASALIATTLDAVTIAQLCEDAAKRSETMEVLIRLEESRPGRLVYSARNRILGGRVEFMTFEVTLAEADGVRHVRTRLLRYKQRRQWILLVPLPWKMLAWGNYRDFMYALQVGVRRADPSASTHVVEVAVT